MNSSPVEQRKMLVKPISVYQQQMLSSQKPIFWAAPPSPAPQYTPAAEQQENVVIVVGGTPSEQPEMISTQPQHPESAAVQPLIIPQAWPQQLQQPGMAAVQPLIVAQASPQQIQHFQQLQQMSYVVLVPAAVAPTSTYTTHEIATRRRGSAAKKVMRPKPHLHTNSVCANCHTTETSMWRTSEFGHRECNACNLYFHNHRVPRPLELAGKEIRRRKRVRPAPTGDRVCPPDKDHGIGVALHYDDHDYLGCTSVKKMRSRI